MGKMYEFACELWVGMAKVNDRLFRKGGDFSGWETQEEAGFSDDKGNKYQPSTDKLKTVLKHFPITSKDQILDIGCGKGKAMYTMHKFPFKQIDGYEISKELCQIANSNFKKLHLQRCHSFVADASNFKDYDKYNYFYIYNSFPENIFAQMLEYIKESLKRKPRKVIFIYLHPVCHNLLERDGTFKLIWKKDAVIDWFTYYCYTNAK